MDVNGLPLYDDDPGYPAPGSASVAIAGRIDRIGSIGGATVLLAMNPNGVTKLMMSTKGILGFSVSGFRPFTLYHVAAWDQGQERWVLAGFATDSRGAGFVTIVATSASFLFAWPEYRRMEGLATSTGLRLVNDGAPFFLGTAPMRVGEGDLPTPW